MAGHSGRASADETLATALAAGRTVKAAAELAGVSERTATRRTGDPAFRRRVSRIRGDMLSQAVGRVVDGMSEAADVLRALLKADSEYVRLAAASRLLELGPKGREASDVEERLRALEGETATDTAGTTG